MSSVELVRALLDRIDRLDPSIRAWETLDGDAALTQAANCDRLLNAEPDPAHSLLGIPFGVKDIIFTAGLPTRSGSPLYASFLPPYDATVVARLKAAGGIVLGKTVTTQFAFVDPVATRNPWDRSRSPGFSSSGSVAAVAARMVPAALSTQTGGSTVRPAAYCGVVGMKPTFGRVGRRGLMRLSRSLDDIGIVARDVEDAGLLLQAAAGAHRNDSTASRRSVPDYRRMTARPPKLGLVVEAVASVDAVVADHFESVVRRVIAAGAHVREIALPIDLDTLKAVQHVTLASEAAALRAESVSRTPDAYQPRVREFIQAGELIPASAYLHAQRMRHRARAAVGKLLAGLDALVLPAQSCEAPVFGTDVDSKLQAPWTLLGFPSMSLPSGLSPNRLPLGVQLVAGHFREDRLVSAARWLEEVLGRMPAPRL